MIQYRPNRPAILNLGSALIYAGTAAAIDTQSAHGDCWYYLGIAVCCVHPHALRF